MGAIGLSRAGVIALAAFLVSSVPAAGGGSAFRPFTATPVGSWPEAVAVGDVTGDGRNDVVMTTGYYVDAAHDDRLWVFAQRAGGGLAFPVSYATAATGLSRPLSVAVGDITGDGRADVVVGIDKLGVAVYPQLSSGSLGPPATTATSESRKIRLGHFNGDNRLDVAGIGGPESRVSVLLNDGHGGLQAPRSYPAPHPYGVDLEVADLTGDGRDDLAVINQAAPPNLSVFPQLLAGGFGTAVGYQVPMNPIGIGVGDLTGDGRKDVVASYGGSPPEAALAVFAQTPAGTLAAPVSHKVYHSPEPVEVADLNGDRRADLVTLHAGWEKAGVSRQGPSGTLAAEELYPIPPAGHYNQHGLAIGDVNGDGRADLVLADFPHGLVVLLNAAAARGCVVPSVIGLLLAKAKAKIKKANCRVGTVRFKPSAIGKRNRVLSERPKRGTRLSAGGKVALVVGRGRSR